MIHMTTTILESRQKTKRKRENNEEERGDGKEIDIKLTEEENARNVNNENVIETDSLFMYPFLFQIVLE